MPKIDEAVLQILSRAVIVDHQLKKLPEMSRPMYEQVNEVLRRLGGKWKGGRTQAHLFDYDFEPVFRAVLESQEMPPDNPLAFFATPPDVVELLMDEADLFDGARVLEPSAGHGAIAERLDQCDVDLTLVELNPINVRVLQDRFPDAAIHAGDFLEFATDDLFDRVVMNPPFSTADKADVWIDHVRHAFDLLKPYGRLVGVVASNLKFRSDKKFQAMREFIAQHGQWQEVEVGAFKQSGTNIATLVVTLDKEKSWRTRPYLGSPSWFVGAAILYSDNNRDFGERKDRLIERFLSGDLKVKPDLTPTRQASDAIRSFYADVSRAAIRDDEPLVLTEAHYVELVQDFMDIVRENAEYNGVELSVGVEVNAQGQIALL